MIRAAIFDMDGLMFDTERLYGDAWLYAGRVTGFPITKELLNRTRGADRGSCISAFREALGDTFDFYAVRRYRQEYVDGYLEKNGMPLKPGLMELLGYLKHSGYGIGLATSTDEPTAREYLGMAGVSGYFDCMIFGDMVKKGKPPLISTLRRQRHWAEGRMNVLSWRIQSWGSGRAPRPDVM